MHFQRTLFSLLWFGVLAGCSARAGMGPTGTPNDPDGGGGQDAVTAPDVRDPSDASDNDLCMRFCARAASASCPEFNRDQCMSACTTILAAPRCRAQAEAAFRCGARATITCDDDGEPTSNDCKAEGAALTMCAQSSP